MPQCARKCDTDHGDAVKMKGHSITIRLITYFIRTSDDASYCQHAKTKIQVQIHIHCSTQRFVFTGHTGCRSPPKCPPQKIHLTAEGLARLQDQHKHISLKHTDNNAATKWGPSPCCLLYEEEPPSRAQFVGITATKFITRLQGYPCNYRHKRRNTPVTLASAKQLSSCAMTRSHANIPPTALQMTVLIRLNYHCPSL
jgi:hypothetical protein